MKINQLLLLIILCCLYSCTNDQTADQNKMPEQDSTDIANDGSQKVTMAFTHDPLHDKARLHGEVLKVHDLVMPKMAQVNRMVRQIKFTLENEQFKPSDAQRNQLRVQLKALENSEEAMTDWMAEFRDPDSSVPHEEAMTYLQQQKNQMLSIDSTIEAALKTSGDLLKDFNKK